MNDPELEHEWNSGFGRLRPRPLASDPADGSFGNGWHEWTDATGFWQRHMFPEGDDYCWCGTYIPWRKREQVEIDERRSG